MDGTRRTKLITQWYRRTDFYNLFYRVHGVITLICDNSTRHTGFEFGVVLLVLAVHKETKDLASFAGVCYSKDSASFAVQNTWRHLLVFAVHKTFGFVCWCLLFTRLGVVCWCLLFKIRPNIRVPLRFTRFVPHETILCQPLRLKTGKHWVFYFYVFHNKHSSSVTKYDFLVCEVRSKKTVKWLCTHDILYCILYHIIFIFVNCHELFFQFISRDYTVNCRSETWTTPLE